MVRALILILVSAAGLFAQQPVRPVPDCEIFFNFTALGAGTSFDNRSRGCNKWVLVTASSGFTTVNLAVQGAQDNGSGAPATFSNWTGTVVSGTHPVTSITSSTVYLEGYFPWVRVNFATLVGSGRMQGVLSGWRQTLATIPASAITGLNPNQILFGSLTGSIGQNSNLVWDIATSRVGIGTSSPSKTLSIAGSTGGIHLGEWSVSSAYNALYLNQTPGSNNYSMLSEGSDLYLNAAGTGRIFFREDNNDLMLLSNTGQLGIRTASPSYTLDVNSNAMAIGTVSAASGQGGSVRYRDDTGTARWLWGIGGYAGQTSLIGYDLVNSRQVVTMDSSGRTGIGSSATSPTGTLVAASPSLGAIPALGTNTAQFAVLGDSGNYGLMTGILSSGTSYSQAGRTDATATAYTYNVQPLGGTLQVGSTGASSGVYVVGADSAGLLRVGGSARGVRIGTTASAGLVEGVDQTGFSSYQDLRVGGLTVALTTSGTPQLTINAAGTVTLAAYTGGGAAYACFNAAGDLVRSAAAC